MSRYWPLFDLRVRTPRVVLRPITDDDLDALCDLALRGVHDPGHMAGFTTPWTDLTPRRAGAGQPAVRVAAYADWTVDDWSLGLGAWEDGVLVGRQDVFAQSFPLLRSVETGSWVGLEPQGRGLGKELRSAVLHLAFEGLGAEQAVAAAFADNGRSLGVTRALGYTPQRRQPQGAPGRAGAAAALEPRRSHLGRDPAATTSPSRASTPAVPCSASDHEGPGPGRTGQEPMRRAWSVASESGVTSASTSSPFSSVVSPGDPPRGRRAPRPRWWRRAGSQSRRAACRRTGRTPRA